MKRASMVTVLATATLGLSLGGCETTQSMDEVKVNKTTIAQAEKMYGEPTKMRYGADGSETWTWEDQGISVTFVDGVATKSMGN